MTAPWRSAGVGQNRHPGTVSSQGVCMGYYESSCRWTIRPDITSSKVGAILCEVAIPEAELRVAGPLGAYVGCAGLVACDSAVLCRPLLRMSGARRRHSYCGPGRAWLHSGDH
jgi:hypothetical protein